MQLQLPPRNFKDDYPSLDALAARRPRPCAWVEAAELIGSLLMFFRVIHHVCLASTCLREIIDTRPCIIPWAAWLCLRLKVGFSRNQSRPLPDVRSQMCSNIRYCLQFRVDKFRRASLPFGVLSSGLAEGATLSRSHFKQFKHAWTPLAAPLTPSKTKYPPLLRNAVQLNYTLNNRAQPNPRTVFFFLALPLHLLCSPTLDWLQLSRILHSLLPFSRAFLCCRRRRRR